MTSVHTHKSHPQTSRDAADSVKDTSELQRRILSLFEEHGAMTHDELIARYKAQFANWWPATESSIRSRTRQLFDKNLLVKRGTKANKLGNQSTLWDIEGRLF